MRTRTFWAFSAAALLSAFALTAGAQDTTRKDVRAQDKDTVRKESKGDVAASATAASFANLLSAVSATAPTTEKIAGLQALKAEQIHLIDAKDIVTASNEADFNKAAAENKDALVALQAALAKNDGIAKALAAYQAKLTAADVIGAAVSDAGDVTIYFRKK